jgi:hypothetical protein
MMILRPEDQALFRPRLLPGERLLWAGRPKTGLLLTAADAFLIPFSLLWGGFAIFWNVSVWSIRAPTFFRLWGMPFLAVGLYMIAGRFLHGAWLRGRTIYALTDRRILFLRAGPAEHFRSIDLDYIPQLELEETRRGLGTITFDDRGSSPWSHFGRRGGRSWVPELQGDRFLAIAQPRDVYELIRRETERRRADISAGCGL